MRAKASRLFLAILIGLATALVPGPASAASGATVETLASGFSSPRGVALFHGELLVAEAGTGGPYCDAAPPNTTICIGRTAQISRVNLATGSHTPLVSGLFSATEFHGGPPEALGSEGLSVSGGRVFNSLGVYPQAFGDIHCAAGDAECARSLATAKAQAGHLISVGGNGSWRSVASVGSYDFNWTAGKPNQEHDSNPYGVLAAEGGAYVADAGSNTLDFVSSRGHIAVLNYFPFRQNAFPSDEVPTCVAQTDETLWVATLAGHLYKVHNGTATDTHAQGLKHVTGCASNDEGSLYLVNMWTTDGPPGPLAAHSGNVVRYNVDGGTSSVVAGGLVFPNMITVGPRGTLYVSANSICPAGGFGPNLCPEGGSVLKITTGRGGED
jgi:hypothetical protein